MWANMHVHTHTVKVKTSLTPVLSWQAAPGLIFATWFRFKLTLSYLATRVYELWYCFSTYDVFTRYGDFLPIHLVLMDEGLQYNWRNDTTEWLMNSTFSPNITKRSSPNNLPGLVLKYSCVFVWTSKTGICFCFIIELSLIYCSCVLV